MEKRATNKKKNPIRWSKILSLLFSFGLIFIFIGGSFSSNTKLEEVAEYATSVAINQTKNKKLFAISVEGNKKSGPILDSGWEFLNLYGTFKQQKITFATFVNADQRHTITIKDIDSSNLAMFYVGAVGTVNYGDHFKHGIYPIEVMFPDKRLYDVGRYVAYISNRHADMLLEKKGALRQSDGRFSLKDYQDLLEEPISISVDGSTTTFLIQNIYLQTNYYYDGLAEIVDDFIMVSYYIPDGLLSEQQNIYFMSDYSYQNKYFMNYIVNAYPSRDYILKVNTHNIVGDINEEYLLSFYYANSKNLDYLFVISIIISSLFLVISLSLFFFILRQKKLSKIYFAFLLILPFMPYFIFSILFHFIKKVSLFSEVSTKINAVLLLIYLFSIFFLLILEKLITLKNTKRTIYEISI